MVLKIYITFLFFITKCAALQNFLNLYSALYESTGKSDEFNIPDTTKFKKEYDFIVIGAGSGGCVVTNRLTENPNWSVLLLEAGGDENFITEFPLGSLVPGIFAYSWPFRTQEQRTACIGMENGRCNWPRGKIMGGSSSINLMVHSRGNMNDFNNWGLNNSGWSYEEVLPYFIKSEKVGPNLLNDIDQHIRGTDGNLDVDYANYATPILKTFLESSKELGYPIQDPNGFHQIGFSRIQANLRNGRRCSASKAYIRPIKNRKNLHIAKFARVTKILINPKNNRAYGVEFLKNHTRYHIRTSKEVILSAGSINSPQLLMLSGIGPKEHLKELNIKPIKDLKVGYNLQDHPSFFGLTFLINQSVVIGPETFKDFNNIYDYIAYSKGPLTVPGGAEALAFLKYPGNTSDSSPDIEVVLGSGGINTVTNSFVRHILGIPELFWNKVWGPVVNIPAFSLVPVLLDVKSRGRIMLRSNNPVDTPLIFANFFKKEEDIKNLIKGVRMVSFNFNFLF